MENCMSSDLSHPIEYIPLFLTVDYPAREDHVGGHEKECGLGVV